MPQLCKRQTISLGYQSPIAGRPFILGKPTRYPYSAAVGGGSFRVWDVTVLMEDSDGFRYTVPSAATDEHVFEPLPTRF